MVQLTRIYTKGGDKGSTSLGSGKRVPKHDPRVAAYGTVDEANAAIGLARLHAPMDGSGGELDPMLSRIQNDLFDLGAISADRKLKARTGCGSSRRRSNGWSARSTR